MQYDSESQEIVEWTTSELSAGGPMSRMLKAFSVSSSNPRVT